MTLDEAINKNIKMAELQERLLSNADDSLKEIVMKYAAEYRQLAEWLRELKERRSGGWISCKDRMPENNVPVLYAGKNDGGTISILFGWRFTIKGLGSAWHQAGTGFQWADEDVTHWQPLPEPPKTGGEQDV